MKKILYNGFYGFQNSGDDAFIEVCAWGAKQYWDTTNNTFLGNNLPEVINPIKSLGTQPFKGYNRLQTAGLALTSDCFISAGGSTFSRHLKYSLKDIAMKMKLNLNRKLKIGAIGVSIGPFRSVRDELSTIEYMKRMDFLAVRDERSYDFACSLDLPYKPINAFDLAALLPDVYKTVRYDTKKDRTKKIIGVSVCNFERYIGGDLSKEEARNNYLLKLLDSIPKDESIIYRFFIFNGYDVIGDKQLTEFFVSKLKDRRIEVVPYLGDVNRTWNSISECDVVISTRLHASIFACYAKVPFFLVEYHQKCTDFLIDVGQSNEYRLNDGNVPINNIIDQIMKILFEKSYLEPVNLLKTKEQARRNFTEVLL